MTIDGERGVGIILDHPFIPRGEWWSLCAECNLSEAAHKFTTSEPVLADTYRCPDCVERGADLCPHR